MRASARLSVREMSLLDLDVYGRVLPKESLLLDCLKWIKWEQLDSKLLAYYSNSGEGQPPYPPTILLKLEFLSYLYCMGRRALIERATCDLHWKYFLGLPIDAALPDHSTLSYFRSRLGAEGFKNILDALIFQAREHGLVSDRLRLKDATHIYADIAVPTALGLFAQLRQRMLTAVKAFDPWAAESFEVALQLMRERSEGCDNQTRLQARVDLVQDIHAWITEQNEPADLTKAKAWHKLQEVRQLAEKILSDLDHPDTGDKTLSVVDPDARCGKHGEYYDGYLLDVMMDAESELITSLEVLPANGDEARDAIDLIESEEQAHGNDIEQLSIDGIGFNGEVLRTLTDGDGLDVEVFTPPRDFTTAEGFDSSQFELIDNGERVRCPAGEVSGKAGRKADKQNTSFYIFTHSKCASCLLLEACCPNFNPAGRTGRRVSKNEYEAEYAAARMVAQSEKYAAVRRRHPAIERKLNEMVRHHHSRRAIYRGLGRVKIQQFMTSFTINIKRMAKLLCLKYRPAALLGIM
jgi:transposase